MCPELLDNEELYRGIFESVTDGLIIADLKNGRVLAANPAACALHGYTCEEFIGRLLEGVIHPNSQDEFHKFLKTFRSDGAFDIRLQHVCRDGSTFYAEWRGTVFSFQGRTCLLGMVRDVSHRIRAEQQLRERVKAHTHEQATLLETSHILASTVELQPDVMLDKLHLIIPFTQAVLFGFSDSTLSTLAVRGPKQMEQAAFLQIAVKSPQALAALFNDNQLLRIADIWAVAPEVEFLRSLLNENSAALLEGVHAWMWVPLVVKGRLIGVLSLAHARRNFFTAHHAALALSMADQTAIAMANAELYEHARTLAALQERQRLAQNLHDAVNQSLFSAGLIAEVLPRLWDRDPLAAVQSSEDLRRLTRGALAEMRELLAELRPSVLNDSSLSDLLRQLANAFTGRTNVPVNLNIAGEHVLPAEIQVAVYRICQETLNNIAKHAEASRVELELKYNGGSWLDTPMDKAHLALALTGVPKDNAGGSVEIRIRDDGVGFNPDEQNKAGHYGLGMMRERAETVQAQLTISAQPGQGTEVVLRWAPPKRQEAI